MVIMDAGPNMAGKSTVMRGTMTVALLGACGLFAPCDAATVPFIDAFMLRTFSADAPVEGLSSFAIEMTEMRCARCLPARDRWRLIWDRSQSHKIFSVAALDLQRF